MSHPSHPSFSVPLFTQLVRRLRHTNARYDQIAHQYRRTRHPTYHAKRHANRAGLRIDTSKARTAWNAPQLSAPPIPLSDRSPNSSAWEPTDAETAVPALNDDLGLNAPSRLALRNLPEVVVQTHGLGCSDQRALVSPLELWSVMHPSDVNGHGLPFQGPVPGAPRWKSIPLPEDECAYGMTLESASSLSHTSTHAMWRGITGTYVPDAKSTPFDVTYAGLGVTAPLRYPKRKRPDVEANDSAVCYRRAKLDLPNDAYFLGYRWNEARHSLTL